MLVIDIYVRIAYAILESVQPLRRVLSSILLHFALIMKRNIDATLPKCVHIEHDHLPLS